VDFEPWWLIFVPVLFALGWIAARVDVRQLLSETRSLPASYFKGLNFLLNEEPDRAIDAFVEVAKLDPETTELHFALGSLFRRRGEIDRAIRVHQSLLARADLATAEREHALHELAQDFLKAGMLDRAEAYFKQLDGTRYALPALRALIRIYESEHDWTRAIDAVRVLRGLVDEAVPQLVHYHCEEAQAALDQQPPRRDAAQTALDAADHAVATASQVSAASVARIAMLRARLSAADNDPKRERLHLQSVLNGEPEYAGLIAEALLANYRAAGEQEAALALLTKQYDAHPSLDLFNIVFRELRARHGAQPAWAFARQALRARPSLLGLDRLLEAELASEVGANPNTDSDNSTVNNEIPANTPASNDLELLRTLIHKHTQRLDRYACRTCGFQARRFYWQCWETYAPRRLEELS